MTPNEVISRPVTGGCLCLVRTKVGILPYAALDRPCCINQRLNSFSRACLTASLAEKRRCSPRRPEATLWKYPERRVTVAERKRYDGKPKGSPIEKGKHHHVRQTQAADGKDSLAARNGHPMYVVNEMTLYELAKTHASFEHMAKILGISAQTLSIRPDFRAIIDRARADQCKHLLAAQFKAAIDDRNPAMLIWLGKQYLDQKDVQRVENTGADGKPQQHEHSFKAVAYFPDNKRNPNAIRASAKQLPAAKADDAEDVPYTVTEDEEAVVLGEALPEQVTKGNPAAEAIAALRRPVRRQARAS